MKPSLFAQIFALEPRKAARFPDVPVDEALAALRALQETWSQAAAAAPPPEPPPAAPAAGPDDAALTAALGNLATQIWRARGRTLDPATGEPREDMRRVHRHVAGALEVLEELGVTLNDWVRQPYDAGLPVKVLTFQPTAGLTRDTILEAVRPTVVWKDRIVQLAEVIVGTPLAPEETPR